jgi:peptidyl-prolyl cis-trans isomerase D
MFDLFRSRAKVVRFFLGAILVLVSLSMLTYLIPSYGGGNSASDMVVAQIGKDTVTLPEVQQVIQAQTRGRQLPPAILANFVPKFVDDLVTQRAMAYEARRMGFKVSDADVARAIRQYIPQLFPAGKFAGKEAYADLLARNNLTIDEFEANITRDLLIQKMKDIALAGIVVTPQEVEQEYKRRSEKVKFEYVKVSPDKLRSEVRVTPDELHKYYETNKMAYQVPEKRNLGILVIDQTKLEQTIQPTEAELLAAYNENKDNFRTPERVKVRHILLKSDGKNPKQDAAVKAKAEDILKQLQAGANFADLAKKYSQDPGSAANGGALTDWVVRGQTVPEFEKAAFSLKPGQLSGLVKTEYGYHIIQVLAHEQPTLKPFAEVKDQLAVEYKKQKVNDLMQQLSDKAQAALTKDPEHPEKVAADLGIQYVKAANVAQGDVLPEVGVNKDFAESIATLKQDEVSQPVLLTPPGNKIALAVCTALQPAHPAAFEDVQDKVRDAVIKEETSKLVDERANQLAQKARAGGDLAAAAKSMGLELKTSNAIDRAGAVEGVGSASYFADAFTQPVGSIFGPIAAADSKVVGKVLEHIPADMAKLAAQRDAIRNELKNRKTQDRTALFEDGVREALIKQGKVKIHQGVLDRLIASYRG